MPVDTDNALGRVIKTGGEVGHRGLARARGSDQRDQLSGTSIKGDSLEGNGTRLRCGFSRRTRRLDRLAPAPPTRLASCSAKGPAAPTSHRAAPAHKSARWPGFPRATPAADRA